MKRLLLLLIMGCVLANGMAQPLKRVKPEQAGMDSKRLMLADSALIDAIERQDIPGAVLAVVRHGKMVWLKAFGNRQVYPDTLPMTTSTIFDMASCSKSMSTAICTMILEERGKIRLIDPVNRYIPGFENWKDENGEETTIRIKHLLTHTSGLHAYVGVASVGKQVGFANPKGFMEYLCHMKRDYEPATHFQYSCLNFVTLQNIIQNISGQSLRQFAQENIFKPLGMKHTDYIPTQQDANGRWVPAGKPVWAKEGEKWLDRVAPTEKQKDGSVLHGVVHDPLACQLNAGISGNAGVFTTADDIAILCAALQNGGEWNGHRILSPQTIKMMRTVPSDLAQFGRALGWDCTSAYASNKGDIFSQQAYCHTGYTGTSIVIDPETDTSVILLMHAVHPVDDKSTVRLRSVVANAVAGSITAK